MYTNELYHHGIKGMKWGVRRYQNEDGSWTEEGKARYGHWKGPNTARYHRLNKKADRGDRLRAEGKTITSNTGRTAGYLIAGAGYAAMLAMGNKGLANISLNWKDKHLGDINPDTIQIGALAAATAVGIHKARQNSDIRASYRRDRYRKDQRWAG